MDDRLLVSLNLDRRKFLLTLATLWAGFHGNAFGRQDNKSKDSKDKDKDGKPAPTVYTPGGDVKAPKVVHYVEPSFSNASKEAFVDGVVRLKTTVTPEGLPSDIEVTRGLNAEEDRTAVEAVKQWRFQPGTKAGEAVHVRVSIEIAFHLM
jgi:TonB family protein